ncbi:MAG TPA: hypothetical protein ENN67_06820, partial [Firmicutes bacterium]|nr:hypothetical protein [Bacillota bacterium]
MSFFTSRFSFYSRVKIALVFLLSVCFFAPSAAHARPIVELLSSAEMEAGSRGMLTVSVRVTNGSGNPGNFIMKVDVPSGWQYIAMPESVELEVGGSEIVFVSVNPPLGEEPGEYGVSVGAYEEGLIHELSVAEILVKIPGTVNLHIRASRDDSPPAYSGDVIEQAFFVTNTGNIRTTASIEIESRQTWRISIDPENRRLELDPNETATVTVRTTVPEELTRSDTYRLTVIIRPIEPVVEEMSWRAGTSTRIVPKRLSSGSIYATLDGNIQSQTSWREDDQIRSGVSIDSLN